MSPSRSGQPIATSKLAAPLQKVVQRVRAALRGPSAAPGEHEYQPELSPFERSVIDRVRQYTMTPDERILALLDAVDYVVRRSIPGSFVECGVWRGGSVLTMILKLQELGITDRDVYLYDTFEGMTEPTEHDTSPYMEPAAAEWERAQAAGERAWSSLFSSEIFGLEQVRELVLSSGYPESRVHFVQGRVEATLPGTIPEGIALLRLDTDWYESTRHELVHLFPRLSDGGVLIIDDYGHWVGAARAVDEYLEEIGKPLLLSRVDYAARLAINH